MSLIQIVFTTNIKKIMSKANSYTLYALVSCSFIILTTIRLSSTTVKIMVISVSKATLENAFIGLRWVPSLQLQVTCHCLLVLLALKSKLVKGRKCLIRGDIWRFLGGRSQWAEWHGETHCLPGLPASAYFLFTISLLSRALVRWPRK